VSDRTTKPKGAEESWPVTSLREYLKRRRGELHAENERLTQLRGKLQNQLHAVLAQLDELDRESAELDQATKAVGFDPEAQTALVPEPAVESRGRPPTIKEAVLRVLAVAPSGMTSKDILDEVNTRFFSGRIERTSFSPELSRLKGEHKVARRGEIWEPTAEGRLALGFEGGRERPRAKRRGGAPGRRFRHRPWRRQSDRRRRPAAPAIEPLRTERETWSGSPSAPPCEWLDPSGSSESSRE
jgi:hypothetical protein